MNEKIVIIGNGVAGHNVIQTLLKSEKNFDITLITKEKVRTYLRTQLAPYALGEIEDNKFFMIGENFYKDNNINVINDEVTKINKDSKTVELKNGNLINYDKLVLSMGSYNFVPDTEVEGSNNIKSLNKDNIYDIEGVCTLREVSDALEMQKYLPTMKKAIVIGGGLLGLEAAWELRQKGIDVTVIEFAKRLLPRQMDTDSALLFKELADSTGIRLILGDSAKNLLLKMIK